MTSSARLGLTFPVWPFDVRRSCEIARRAEGLGYTDGWTSEVSGADGLAVAAAIGAVTEHMRIGCAIASAFARAPALLAMGALAAQQASGGRFCLGIGASSPVIVERWMGMSFERPATRVAETLKVVRAAMTGEKVRFEGETLGVSGFKLDVPAEPPVPVYLAALGPKMMALAAREADGIALFLAAEPGVRLAAERAPDLPLVARVLCCPGEPEDDVRDAARWMLAPYAAVPGYNRFLMAQGFEDEATSIAAAWSAGDRAGALQAVSDRLVDALVLLGPAERCKERLESLRAAGLDTPILGLFSTQGGDGTLAAINSMAP